MYNIKFWIKVSLFNILLVAFLGLLMRYKIAFYLPFVDQKHLLHAHSHFAFIGWISQTLYVFIIQLLMNRNADINYRPFKNILIANLFISYGLIPAFIAQGYGAVSITLSTLSILVFYIFCIKLFQALNHNKNNTFISDKWLKAALVFGILSTVGTFLLAYSMKISINQNLYLASFYFYLHFQYNGWFLFASVGLAYQWLKNNIHNFKEDKKVFLIFLLTCIPNYFLSTLWADLPVWLFIIVVFSSILQTIAWILMVKNLLRYKSAIKTKLHKTATFLFALVAIAYTIKILLQLGSTIPALSELAFGFRSIVIAYLHLILLGVFTLYFLAIFVQNNYIQINRFAKFSLYSFVAGVFLNEFVLMVQGTASLISVYVPHTNIYLLIVAILLFISISGLFFSQLNKNKTH